MARKSKLWRDGEEKFREHSQGGMREGILTKPESIRIFCPSGCGSFWLKEESSFFGVSPWIRRQSEIILELSKILRNTPIVNF